jgi:hypothetical protein
MFPRDSLVLDVIFPARARPTAEQVTEGLGGEAVTQSRMIVDIDLDLPQIEAEVSPTFLLRRRGERRVFIVDEASGPLRQSPRTQPIVARDLRPERDRLAAVVEKTGARLGRLGAFGAWGDAVIVARSARDLRAVMLLSWALDPRVDLEGNRRASPLSEQELELKLASFDKRLEEIDDATILSRVPPATLERRGPKDAPLLVVSVLSDRDGSWDVRKSYELEKRVGAIDLFSRIPGARSTAAVAAAEPELEPEPEPEPPRPAGPPIGSVEIDGRIVLRIPGERLHSETVTALGKRPLDALAQDDPIPRPVRDRIEQTGCGFVAPLEFLSEVFLEGKPLDRRRFEEGATEVAPGVKTLEAHLPRYGGVWVIETAGGRWVTSEVGRVEPVLAALRDFPR